MNHLRITSVLATLVAGGSFVFLGASCASEGEEPSAQPPITSSGDDAGDAADASTIITDPDAAPPIECGDGRFCSVPTPVTAPISLNGIWGSSANDVWIVASPDVAIHWDGAKFTSTKLNTNQTLFGVWGTEASDVWAFSTGNVVWHSSGGAGDTAWSGFDKDAGDSPWSGPIFGMWGKSATDIWAVGQSFDFFSTASVWHCTGWNEGFPQWTPSVTTPNAMPWDTEPAFNAIWGSASGEVWVVGAKGKTRYTSGWSDEGVTWNIVDSGTSVTLNTVWGAANGDVWAAGSAGTMRRFTKQADGFFVAEEIPFPNRSTIRSLLGFAPDDIWAAGSDATLAHWDGTAWSLVSAGPSAGTNELFALWASSPNDIWAVGRNTLLHKGSTLLPGMTP